MPRLLACWAFDGLQACKGGACLFEVKFAILELLVDDADADVGGQPRPAGWLWRRRRTARARSGPLGRPAEDGLIRHIHHGRFSWTRDDLTDKTHIRRLRIALTAHGHAGAFAFGAYF
eukprot:scaffold868_cov21-Prasinocladus_malaysianus.AAC.1